MRLYCPMPWKARPKGPLLPLLASCLAIALFFWTKPPVMIGFDPSDEKCLVDLHLSLLVRGSPAKFAHGDYVFWDPSCALAYVRQPYVLKQVAGVPGDRLQITATGQILVNGVAQPSGLPLARLYHRMATELARDEVIPPGKLFMLGSHPNSDDSRYWGYLDMAAVRGKGYKLL